jgi:hypothetical protein
VTTVGANRRRAERKPVDHDNVTGVLTIGRQAVPVLAFDESTHGIGLVAVNAPPLQIGASVEFESHARKTPGRIASIRYINTLFACIYCIGLEWAE